MKAARQGMYPIFRHGGAPFSEHDEPSRAARVGAPLGLHASLIDLKADLAEYGHTLGFPIIAQNVNPCFLRRCVNADFVLWEGFDLLTIPWPLKSLTDYNDACTWFE